MDMRIGDFARLGHVSVRMLRHYDHIGLLRPAHVDPATGYRTYSSDQLAELNRVLALKDLGLSLQQVAALATDDVPVDELRGMLRLKRSEVESELREQRLRLDRVEARLRLLTAAEQGRADIVVSHVARQRYACLIGHADDGSVERVAPIVQPLFERVCDLMDTARVPRTTPVAWYVPDETGPEGALRVHAGFVLTSEEDVPGAALLELPAARVASVVHHGAMSEVFSAYQALGRWATMSDEHVRTVRTREIYLETPENDSGRQDDWVTEVQLELDHA